MNHAMVAYSGNRLATTVLAVALLFAISCSEKAMLGPSLSVVPAPARVDIDPPADTINALGYTTTLSAVVYDSTDAVMAGEPVIWTASRPANATVTDGIVTATSRGVARIFARAGTASDTSRIWVRQIVKDITVTAPGNTVNSGETLQITASAVDSNDVAVDGATLVWTSSNENVATVDASGLVTAHASGRAQINVRFKGAYIVSSIVGRYPITSVYDTAYFKISPANDTIRALGYTRQMTTPPLMVDATPVAVTWNSLNPNVATIDPVTGLATAVRRGVARITAKAGLTVDTVNLYVAQYPATLDIPEESTTIIVGATDTIASVMQDSGGTSMPGPIDWISRDSLIVKSLGRGVVTGMSVGSVYIVAHPRSNAEAIDSALITVMDVDASTHTWGNGVAGNWTDATKWSPGYVPAETDTAVIAPTGSAVTLTAATVIGALAMSTGATLDIGTFDLTVSTDLLVDTGASITSGGGTILLTGFGNVRGSLPRTRVTGSVLVSGNTTLTGALTITGSLSIADQALTIALP